MMKLSKPVKIAVGILTAGEVLFPFLSMAAYFLFIFSIASIETAHSPSPEKVLFSFFFIFMFVLFIGGMVQFLLQVFYLAHAILNKSGNDVLKVVLGLLAFFFGPIGMPVYYFVFIWPATPPAWALSPNAPSTINPSTEI
jgi:hypothetical protein